MAKRSEASQIADLTPESTVLTLHGEDVRVPGNKAEAEFMGKILASQVMHIYQKSLKKYSEDDLKFSPKELKDVIEGGRLACEMLGSVYAKDEVSNSLKSIQSAQDQTTTDVDFSALSKVPEVATQPNADKSSPGAQPKNS